jgi:hypothetical protein
MKTTVLMRTVQSQNSTEWDASKEIGTVKENLDKTDILSLSNKNLAGDAPHAILFVRTKEDAVPTMLFLTKPLSKLVRKANEQKVSHKEIIKSLLPLKMANLTVETEEGEVEQTFIIAPGKQGESFTTAELLKGEVVTLEALIA